MDFYVYYRAQESLATTLHERVRRMQAELAAKHSIEVALKRRPEADAGLHTWMEIYLSAPANFASVLEVAVQEHGLHHLITDRRHVERFIDGELGK